MKKKKNDRRPLFFKEKNYKKIYITDDIYFYASVSPDSTDENNVIYDSLYSMDQKELIFAQDFNIIDMYQKYIVIRLIRPISYSRGGYCYECYNYISYNVESSTLCFNVNSFLDYDVIHNSEGFSWLRTSIFVIKEVGYDTYKFIDYDGVELFRNVKNYILEYDKIAVEFTSGQSIYARSYECDEKFDVVMKVPMFKKSKSNPYILGKIYNNSSIVYQIIDAKGYMVKDLYFRKMKVYEGAMIVEETEYDGIVKNNYSIVYDEYAKVTRLDKKFLAFSNIVNDRIFGAVKTDQDGSYKLILMDLNGKEIFEVDEVLYNFEKVEYGDFTLDLAVGFRDEEYDDNFFYFDKNGKIYPQIGNEKFQRGYYPLQGFNRWNDFKEPLLEKSKNNY